MFLSKNRQEQRERVISFKKFFGTPEGKVVLYYLINKYHVLNSHNGDPLKEGQRSVVLEILSLCNVSVEQLDELLKGDNQ